MLKTKKQGNFKINGLFCNASENSLERLIVYGMGMKESKWPKGKTLHDLWINEDAVSKVAANNAVVDDSGYAKEQCDRCEAPDFPCMFASKFPSCQENINDNTMTCNNRVSKNKYLLLSKFIVDYEDQLSLSM